MHRLSFLSCLLIAVLLATPAAAQSPVALAEFAARRTALLDAVGEGVTVVRGADAPELDFMPYRQTADFYYLTGFREPEAALVMVRRGTVTRQWLFVPPRDPAQEVWTGRRVGVEGTQAALGIEGRHHREVQRVVDSLTAAGGTLHQAQRVNMAIRALRGVKSPAEIERLRIAIGISARGHLAAMRVAVPGIAEFELQAAAEYQWRREGSDGPGYLSILGSGPNSTTLHYNENARVTQPGDVVVMDMAGAFDGYTADITRTIPVDGRFTDAQKEIYRIVLDAQKSAERQVRVGASWRALIDSSNAALSEGLTRIGLIEAPGATYDCGSAEQSRQCTQLSLFYMHGLGHGIGLDVHDPDQYERTGRIGVGSAFTIEPGVYVRVNTASLLRDTPRNRVVLERLKAALARYEGIGVRIEDDYLVTAEGVERPSDIVPREIEEVEAVLQLPRTERVPGVGARFTGWRSGR